MERKEKKFDLLLWDFQKTAMEWLEDHMDGGRFSVVGHLDRVEEMLDQTPLLAWDYILCFIPAGREDIRGKFDDIFRRLGISLRQVIYAQELEDWVRQRDVAFYLLKGDLRSRMALYCQKEERDYVTCTVEGISYIAASRDRVILDWMAMYGQNWAWEEMREFERLSRKYYAADSRRRGYFVDIGANIGTTCIYFKKRVDENIDILAFEPERENYKLLTANLLINDLAEESRAENLGLSSETEQRKLHKNSANPGGNSVMVDYGEEAEEIRMVSLDGYLKEHGIAPEEIKYLWIDTEGFEPAVLSGAQETLRQGNIPVFMEFNPFLWQASGMYEQMMAVLEQLYTQYLFVEAAGAGEPRPVGELWEYREAPRLLQKDLFLIE